MLVVLLLAAIWAVVLVPPALMAHRERQEAFLISIGQAPEPEERVPRRYSSSVQRRRRIAGGLLVAMAVTLVVGLLPTFRVFLVVHLFLLDSFLGYVAVLAHQANRRGAVRDPRPEEAPATRVPTRAVPRPAIAAAG